ncbi:hypothetical protein T05_407 [Trichinella murrelli]|uniref:Uncharacterized protein n=1 Tax=Trichinella murrelli TaxID=144512 RepID=A0A0V0TBI7_9BILA|nr:hypothetical protein T05_407 [Trichinella murrelli]
MLRANLKKYLPSGYARGYASGKISPQATPQATLQAKLKKYLPTGYAWGYASGKIFRDFRRNSPRLSIKYVVFAKTACICVIFFDSLKCTPPVLMLLINKYFRGKHKALRIVFGILNLMFCFAASESNYIVFCIQLHECKQIILRHNSNVNKRFDIVYHEFSWLVISLVAVTERPELQFHS